MELQVASAAQAVRWFEATDIQDQLFAEFREIEAAIDRDRLPASSRGLLSREIVLRGALHHEWILAHQIREAVPTPVVDLV